MVHEGHLLLVLHDRPGADPQVRAASFFWRAPDGSWKSTGAAAKGGVGALKGHVEAYAAAAQALEDRLDAASRANDYFAVLQEVAPLLRSARNMHRVLQEAREACPDDRDLLALRDQAYENERTLDLIHGDARNGLDFTIARRAEEQALLSEEINRSSHRLNLLAALFFPITALAGILGMNLEHGFERMHTPWLFLAVVAVAFLVGLLVRSAISGGRAPRSP
ncbi:Hypothetical protein CAP_8946 [Chondromyces apiculatus DSM 436]|uniref:Magnesium and cobalt transport protein CorA n=2 Tax=Chondromyces apiculatus TaxID=51 RepID=A0A017SVQ0_9BACT|nr:Hypothetical protein CAP_8946 [Chondromyces apiculatus DSM 436]